MNVGSELYSSLSMMGRQSLLMFTELPEMVTAFELTPDLRLRLSVLFSPNTVKVIAV